MNKGFPENVYRAPYEFISATTYGASSLLMVLLPIPKMYVKAMIPLFCLGISTPAILAIIILVFV